MRQIILQDLHALTCQSSAKSGLVKLQQRRLINEFVKNVAQDTP